jgi:hypothetical protein
MTTTAPDIFLSYNREDQARGKLFAEAFEAITNPRLILVLDQILDYNLCLEISHAHCRFRSQSPTD